MHNSSWAKGIIVVLFCRQKISKIIKLFITFIRLIEEIVPSKEHERFHKSNKEAQAYITNTDHDLRKGYGGILGYISNIRF